MNDDPEKIADVALHQRADLMLDRQRLLEALVDLRELVEDEVDIDRNGNANLAMKVFTIVTAALGEGR